MPRHQRPVAQLQSEFGATTVLEMSRLCTSRQEYVPLFRPACRRFWRLAGKQALFLYPDVAPTTCSSRSAPGGRALGSWPIVEVKGCSPKTSDDQQEVVLHAAQTLPDRSQAAASRTTTSAEGWLHSLVESENLFSDCKVDWPGMTLQSLPGSFVVVGQAQRNAMHRSCVPAFICLSEARTVSGAGFPCSGKPRCRQSPRSGTWTLELEGGREDRPRWQVLDRKREGKKRQAKSSPTSPNPAPVEERWLATKTPKGNFTSLEGSRTRTISVAESPTRAPPNAAEPTRCWLIGRSWC
jgi:hypothetical protein